MSIAQSTKVVAKVVEGQQVLKKPAKFENTLMWGVHNMARGALTTYLEVPWSIAQTRGTSGLILPSPILFLQFIYVLIQRRVVVIKASFVKLDLCDLFS